MSVIGQAEGIAHGTLKGYKQHIYRKVKACEECLQAVREDNAKRPRKSTTAKATERKPSPTGVIHSDTAREPAHTYIPYQDAQGLELERRERIKAALTCMLLDPHPGDLIETLGIPQEEFALARQVADRLSHEVAHA